MKARVTVYQIKINKTGFSVPYLYMDWDCAVDNGFCKSDYVKVADLLIEGSDDREILDATFRLSNEGQDDRFNSFHSISTSDVIIVEGRTYYVKDRGFERIPKSMWNSKPEKSQKDKFDWDKIKSEKPEKPTAQKKLNVESSELELVKSILKGLTIKVEGSFKLDVTCTAVGLDLHAEYKDYKGSLEL